MCAMQTVRLEVGQLCQPLRHSVSRSWEWAAVGTTHQAVHFRQPLHDQRRCCAEWGVRLSHACSLHVIVLFQN